ncbi:MAG TPA: hypothetical protein VF221_01140, partial [Chloroflexota bacterium]
AVSAARAAQSGRASGAPKGGDGAVEALRAREQWSFLGGGECAPWASLASWAAMVRRVLLLVGGNCRM